MSTRGGVSRMGTLPHLHILEHQERLRIRHARHGLEMVKITRRRSVLSMAGDQQDDAEVPAC